MQGLGATITGIMRGVGKQKVGLVNTFVGNYFVGLPMAYILCFRAGLFLNGLWLGCALGVMTSVTLNIYYLNYKADWEITDKKMLMRRGPGMKHEEENKSFSNRSKEPTTEDIEEGESLLKSEKEKCLTEGTVIKRKAE